MPPRGISNSKANHINNKLRDFDICADYFHMGEKIPFKEELFETQMNNNQNTKVLEEKIFSDICTREKKTDV